MKNNHTYGLPDPSQAENETPGDAVIVPISERFRRQLRRMIECVSVPNCHS
jgi:hypothetical protein